LVDEEEERLLIIELMVELLCVDDEKRVTLLVLEHSELKQIDTFFEYDFLQIVIINETGIVVMVDEDDGIEDESEVH
jgi:hypothetical protein